MLDQTFGDLFSDFDGRIKRTHGILENHADVTAADAFHLLLRFGRQVNSAK